MKYSRNPGRERKMQHWSDLCHHLPIPDQNACRLVDSSEHEHHFILVQPLLHCCNTRHGLTGDRAVDVHNEWIVNRRQQRHGFFAENMDRKLAVAADASQDRK